MSTRKKLLQINKTTKTRKPEIKTINNYRVVFIKSNSRLLSIQSYIFNGFIHETCEDVGVNHLLEHVLANAYKKCKKFNCFEYLTKLGIQYNASTSDNILNYYTFGLNQDIDKMLEYIVKITIEPEFNEKLVNREKQAVNNELLAWLDNSRYAISNRVSKLLYNLDGLKYSGDAEKQISNLKRFNNKNLQEYYRKNYTNNNTLFVISGNYNKRDIIKKLNHYLPNAPKQEKINYNSINCFTNVKTTEFLKNSKLKSTQIYLCFPTQLKYNSKRVITLNFVKEVLHYYLFQLLRVKHRLVYGIELSIDVNVCGTTISLFINTKNDNLLKVLTLVKYTINYYKKNIVSNRDIEQFKKKFIVNYYNKKYTPKELANLYGIQYIYQHFLGTKILHPDRVKNIYMNVEDKDIQKSICENLNFDKLICVYSNNDCSVDFKF